MPMPFDEAAQVLARARQVARWGSLRLRRQLTWKDVERQDLKGAEDAFDIAWRRAQALRPKPTSKYEGTLTGLDCPSLFRHESGAIVNLNDIAQGDERIAEVVRKHRERAEKEGTD